MDIAKQLENALAAALEKDHTVYSIAKEAGLKPELLYRFLRGERSLQLASAAKLATALGLVLALPENTRSDIVKPLHQVDFRRIKIDWTKPQRYDRFLTAEGDEDSMAKLYMIRGQYSNAESKIVYLGKTFSRFICHRLKDADHRERYAKLQADYPKHVFSVSLGVLELDGRLTKKRLDEIERILIYASFSEHTANIRNLWHHGVSGSYAITNCGYRLTLPSEVALGVFAK